MNVVVNRFGFLKNIMNRMMVSIAPGVGKPMSSEKSFETQIKKFLDAEGCWFLKVWGGGFQKSGIPDLLICCNGYFVAVEVKGDRGRASELQRYHLDQIKKAGGAGLILYPKDFDEFKTLIKKLKGGE